MQAYHGSNLPSQSNEFRAGWHIVLLGLVGLATSASVAVMYAFGAMVVPLQEAFGWSRGEIQTGMTFYSVGSVVTMQLAGVLSTRFGLRKVAICSLVALSAFYLLLTQITSLPMLYAGCALITFAGVGTLHITWTQLIALWFKRNLGAALAIILTGSGLAATFLPTIVTWAIQAWGWQAGFVVLAIPPILITLPLALRWLKVTVCSEDGEEIAPEQLSGFSFAEGIRTRAFWFLAISMVLVIVAVWGMLINIVPLLQDRGLSAVTASQVFAAYGIALIVGRLVVGVLMDRLWAPAVACVVLVLPAVGCVIFLFADPAIPLMVLATLLVGVGVGAEMDIAAFLAARYFGLREYGRMFGLLMALMAGGGCLAPFAFGALYDRTGSYDIMLWVCAALFVSGALMLLSMGRYPDFRVASTTRLAEGSSMVGQPDSCLRQA